MPTPTTSHHSPLTGDDLVRVEHHVLPLLGTSLVVDASGGVARTILTQQFRNPYTTPLGVTYSLPLPADATVSGFAFRMGAHRIIGEVAGRDEARDRFEQALLDGQAAVLLEQDRSSLFTQELANIPPGEEVVAEITIDQRLRWLEEGAWEWRFPTTVAPRYLGREGRVADAARIRQHVEEGPMPLRTTLALTIRDQPTAGRKPESPSHRIQTEGTRVSLAEDGGAVLDRDLVVRWQVSLDQVAVGLNVARLAAGSGCSGDAFALLTLVPPAVRARAKPFPRDLLVLLDTSGSMAGRPLDHARRIVAALLDTLGDGDQLEMLAFSSAASRWKPGPVAATAASRHDALLWLANLKAGGGTEMLEALQEELRPLRPRRQRQVVLVTDGHVGFESEIVTAIASGLSAFSRVHTVGVGSAVNRTLTRSVARTGRGIEVIADLGEDPERAAQRIVAATDAPVVVDVVVAGPAVLERAPEKVADVFARAPLLVALRLRPEGGRLSIRGQTTEGAWEHELMVPPMEVGCGPPAVVSLFGREAIEDRETWLVEQLARDPAVRQSLARQQSWRSLFDAEIEKLGLNFQIASRLTSWVAVREDPAVDPTLPKRHERVPHQMPFGMSIEGLGLRKPALHYGDVDEQLPKDKFSQIVVAGLPDRMRGAEGVRSVQVTTAVGVKARDEEERTAVTGTIPELERASKQASTDCLLVIYTKEPTLLGRRCALDRSPIRVGRGEENDIVLESDSVSRHHARLELRGEAWWCVDDGSTNGSYINDEPVLREARLYNGDRIKIGSTIFKFLSGHDIEAQYYEEIYRMTIIDGLTQLHVKRYLVESLDKEFTRARRHKHDLAFLMLDIDHFKTINDQHGHLAGDYVLKEIACVIRQRIRRDEVAARFGGEEFAVLLPDTVRDGARQVAESIRERVERTPFTFDGIVLRATLSIGVSSLEESDATGLDLVQRADKNLYAAKRAGRNSVVG